MAYLGCIDCGTTNSRVAIVDEKAKVHGWSAGKVGVKTTAITGSNAALKEGLAALFDKAVSDMGISAQEVEFVISSGMITSELGILEIPHLIAPAGKADFSLGLRKAEGTARIAINPALYLIPGVKNRANPRSNEGLLAARSLDFMRGEETQILGLLAASGGGCRSTVVNLSSHTKYINIDAKDRILGSITTLSGQVYESLIKETFIGKSVLPPAGVDGETDSASEKELEDATDLAYELVEKSGLLRSFMLPRFMDTLMDTDWRIRRRFVESCLVADDLKAMNLFPEYGFDLGERVVLVGLPERCRIFQRLLERSGRSGHASIQIIADSETVAGLAIRGSLEVARGAGLIA
jgi:2-dehydro-3-deoxygalactonokinase